MKSEKTENVSLSVVSDYATLWTVVCQAPLSMEFSRQEYWNVLPFPPPGVLLDPGLPHRRQILYYLSHQGSPTTPPLQNCQSRGLESSRVVEQSRCRRWCLERPRKRKNGFSFIREQSSSCLVPFHLLLFLVIFSFLCGPTFRAHTVSQSCPTLCNPLDCSSADSSVRGISQARILEWVAISSSRISFLSRD